MPRYPVKQPDGNYAVWSTITDSIVAFNCDEKSMIESMLELYDNHTFESMGTLLIPAIERMNHERMNQWLSAWDWSQTWPDVCRMHVSYHGIDSIIVDIVDAGLYSMADAIAAADVEALRKLEYI